jgi:hypothetical protein
MAHFYARFSKSSFSSHFTSPSLSPIGHGKERLMSEKFFLLVNSLRNVRPQSLRRSCRVHCGFCGIVLKRICAMLNDEGSRNSFVCNFVSQLLARMCHFRCIRVFGGTIVMWLHHTHCKKEKMSAID